MSKYFSGKDGSAPFLEILAYLDYEHYRRYTCYRRWYMHMHIHNSTCPPLKISRAYTNI